MTATDPTGTAVAKSSGVFRNKISQTDSPSCIYLHFFTGEKKIRTLTWRIAGMIQVTVSSLWCFFCVGELDRYEKEKQPRLPQLDWQFSFRPNLEPLTSFLEGVGGFRDGLYGVRVERGPWWVTQQICFSRENCIMTSYYLVIKLHKQSRPGRISAFTTRRVLNGCRPGINFLRSVWRQSFSGLNVTSMHEFISHVTDTVWNYPMFFNDWLSPFRPHLKSQAIYFSLNLTAVKYKTPG